MSAEEHNGLVVCPACGTPLEHTTDLVASLRSDVDSLEIDLRSKRRHIKKLIKARDASLHSSPHYEVACDVLATWAELCAPKARELESYERMSTVIDRLAGGYTADELKQSIKGYSTFPYVINWKRVATGPPSSRRVEIEKIFATPGLVDQGLALLEQQVAYSAPLPTPQATSSSSLSHLGNAAIIYANRGLQVFPCVPGTKRPLTINGLLDATGDLAKIRWWWERRPNANIGIRTGKESGIVVLDVDDKKGGFDSLLDLEQKHEKLPETASVVATPNGGSHYYFQYPAETIRNSVDLLGVGLDIRGDGGYVLASPSIVDGRYYSVDRKGAFVPMPAWLLKEIETAHGRPGAKIDSSVWENMIAHGLKAGNRNTGLTRLCGHLLNREEPGVTLGLLRAVNEQRCSPPLPDREVEAIVKSISKKANRNG